MNTQEHYNLIDFPAPVPLLSMLLALWRRNCTFDECSGNPRCSIGTNITLFDSFSMCPPVLSVSSAALFGHRTFAFAPNPPSDVSHRSLGAQYAWRWSLEKLAGHSGEVTRLTQLYANLQHMIHVFDSDVIGWWWRVSPH